jgi:type VI secretion system protein ImpL
MTRYIVAGVICLLAFLTSMVMPRVVTPFWLLLIVGFTVLVLALLWAVDQLRERSRSRALEKALHQQAARQAEGVRPDLQAEVQEMQAEFQKAIGALKGSRRKGNALYALPWYTIIGPPGCGKSTALRTSGLQFPYLSASGGGVRGLGGTRNCDWWLTNDAVILDTAGRWTSEDEDRDEWLSFLDLVKQFRPKKPLNGVIAAVSVDMLGGAREDQVIQLARRIRERIDEVMGRLQMSLPVYVLFTKCDLIPGFIETFGSMDARPRGQVWGFTAPLSKPITQTGPYFDQRFEELVNALERRSLMLMAWTRRIDQRDLIFAFPQQVRALQLNLKDFVDTLFQDNVFKETPRMRGVYFTSGTQEGRPIDRAIGNMLAAIGQDPQQGGVQLPPPGVDKKSYFLRDVFSQVVFKDKDVAVRSPAEIRRQRVRAFGAGAAILGLALLVAVLPGVAWATNGSYMAGLQEDVDTAIDAINQTEGPAPIGPVNALRERYEELRGYATYGPPVYMGFGLYPDEIAQPVEDTYLGVMRERVIRPLLALDVREMRGLASAAQLAQATGRAPDVEPRALLQAYEALKLHLLMTSPTQPTEPELGRAQRRFVRDQLLMRWGRVHEYSEQSAEWRQMGESIDAYIAAMSEDPDRYRLERDVPLVAVIQPALRNIGGYQVMIALIVDRLRSQHYQITLDRLVNPNLTYIGMVRTPEGRSAPQTEVPGAFTQQAWANRVQRMLDEDAREFFQEGWVIGDPPPENTQDREADLARKLEDLQQAYFERYIAEWMGFLASVGLRQPRDEEELLTLYTEILTGRRDQDVWSDLVQGVRENVYLSSGAPSQAAVPAGGVLDSVGRVARSGARQALNETGSGNLGNALDRAAAQRMRGQRDPRSLLRPETIHQRFLWLLDLAPRVEPGESTLTPVRTYDEQVEFVQNALQNVVRGSGDRRLYEARRAAAIETTEQIVERLSRDHGRRYTPFYERWLLEPLRNPIRTEAPPEPPPAPRRGARRGARSGGRGAGGSPAVGAGWR